jgi:hypothetical protein
METTASTYLYRVELPDSEAVIGSLRDSSLSMVQALAWLRLAHAEAVSLEMRRVRLPVAAGGR